MPIQATPEARATGTRRGWALPLRGPRWAEQPSRASRLPQEPAHRAARVLACPPRGRLAAPRTCVVGLSPAACRACWPRRSRSAPCGSPGEPPASAHPPWAKALPEAAQTASALAAAPHAAHESPADSATAGPCAIPVWAPAARRIAGRAALRPLQPRSPVKPSSHPRADVKTASQEIVAATAEARRARQFVWQPAPKLELHTDLQSPNLLAIRAPRAEPPPKPKLFVPPPEAPSPTGDAPMLGAPPEIRTARNVNGAANMPGMQPAKAPPRTFVAPPAGRAVDKPAPALPDAPVLAATAKPAMAAPPTLGRGVAKPRPFGSPLPEPPALPESASASAVSMAIVGLNPSADAPAPAPEGSRNAQFSAAPQPRRTGGTDGSVDDAILTVPGLFIRSGVPDAKPAPM